MRRYRVLLIAEAANPEWTSVPLVGYYCCMALREITDAHIVTQVRNRDALQRAGLCEGVDFTAIDSEPVARPLWRATDLVRRATGLGWTFETAMQTLPYYYFESQLWERFGPEIKSGKWDIVHRVTPLSPTTPSIIAGRCRDASVPFVLGPLNGGVPWPKGFSEAQHKEGEWLSYVRDAYKLLPGYRATRKHTSAILTGSRATFQQLPAESQAQAVYIPENGIDPQRFDRAVQGPVRAPLRIAFVGRLVPYKGADMLIEACAELIRAGKVEIDIIGDGPEREPLRALCERLAVSHGVKLDGWVAHKELPARLMQSDVFGFPSVREFGGAVVLEAMVLGLVPIIADYAGPAEHVVDGTGFRVALGSRAALMDGVKHTVEQLVADPSTLRAMGERARQRVLDLYTWQAKAKQIHEVYRWVRGERAKPNFGMPLSND
jgi:alpha-maltose-1-phosphate synthase